MNKKLLVKIPIQNIPDEIIRNIETMKEETYAVTAQTRTIEENKILLLYFYHQRELKEGNTKAAFRVFISKDNYITQDLKSTRIKWKTGCIRNLIGGWYGWTNQCTILDDNTSDIIKDFLDEESNPLQAIEDLQSDIMAKRLDNKHRVIKDRIDKQMKIVPDLPKGFREWIDKTALFKSRYIFYKYKSRKKLDGYCTNCKADVLVESPRHNLSGRCPNCKSPIVYKAMGKSRNVIDRGQASLIQKVEDKIVVRYFSIYKSYQRDYKNPKISFTELTRDFYDEQGNITSYEYMNFKQSGDTRWCDGEGKFGFHDAILYEKNLDKALKGTIWQYSAIKLFATHTPGFGFQTFDYLQQYMKYPLIEYLVKSKLYKLTNQVIYKQIYSNDDINLKGKNLQEILNIDKSQLITAQRIDAGKNELDVIRKFNKADLNLTDNQILFISENLRIERVIEMSKYTTVHKIIKYVKTQGNDVSNAFNDWYDYLINCKLLGYDLKNKFVLFPKDLKEAHDNVEKLVERNENELFNKVIQNMSLNLGKKYNWKYQNYLIIAPATADEIVQEGQTLHHCVGNYIERVAKGKTIILFLRDKENINEPYYTLEIDPVSKRVEQCRGKNNSPMTNEIKNIIEKYRNDKLSPLAYKEAV